jgi:uncharacterized protein (DUF1810 family)
MGPDGKGSRPIDDSDLERFVEAQDARNTLRDALDELRAGRKVSHWMWFVFPQIAGLGQSSTSRRYGISGLDEARDYLRHPVLGPRLRECTQVVGGLAATSAEAVFGPIDAQKLRSSMTLFLRAHPGDPVFRSVLDRFFDGSPDPATDALI